MIEFTKPAKKVNFVYRDDFGVEIPIRFVEFGEFEYLYPGDPVYSICEFKDE